MDLQSKSQFGGEVIQTARGGRRFPCLCRWVMDSSNESILTSCTDITERRKMEDELRQAHALLADRAGHLEQAVTERTAELTATSKQLKAFVYSIAHDLRAPLRSMQGFSTLLVEEAAAMLSETSRSYAQRISTSAQYMDALLTDLLTFSGIAQQRVELTSVDLESVVQSVIAHLKKEIHERNAHIETIGPWPKVMAHDATLGQV